MDTGNTYQVIVQEATAAVQPRGYGEHQRHLAAIGTRNGSAPWIRGTLPFIDNGVTRLAVQPRGYGEHDSGFDDEQISDGSAPWIRGTHSGHVRHSHW